MFEEEGLVKAVTGDKAFVLMERKAECAHCMARKGCHVVDDGKEIQAKVLNPISAAVGDRVRISIQEGVLLKSSFILYFVPAMGVIAGSSFGYYLGKLNGWNVDQSAMLFGLLTLGFSFLVAFFVNRHTKEGRRYWPQIQEIITKANEEVLNNGSISEKEDKWV